jgi:exonuclease III
MALRNWKVLSWNVRGLNSEKKSEAIRDKIISSSYDIVCLQETKKQSFDHQFIRNLCPIDFDAFDYIPSLGASGGSIVIWKSNIFSGTKVFSK